LLKETVGACKTCL